MRILIVKLSSIGDIVHTLPSAAAIRRSLPHCELYWVAERQSAELLRNNHLLDGLIEVDIRALRSGKAVLGKTLETAFRQFQQLRSSGLDLSIDFQGLIKSATIAKLSGSKRRFGFDKPNLREPASSILLTDRIRTDPVQNIVFKNLELAERSIAGFLEDEAFTLEKTPVEFPISTSKEDRRQALEVVAGAGEFAILNPGGGWVTKLWRAEDYGSLADMIANELGLTPVLAVGPGEKAISDRVMSASKSGKLITAEIGLKAFYELARKASVYVGGDTGPTHIAVAAGCPVVGIFGPTEWWRNGSVFESDICVGRDDIECRIDCHRRECDRWICMDIPPAEVLAAVGRRLELGRITDRGPVIA